MPSGAKKRKSSKRPKPKGSGPELEAGLEEGMEDNGVEVGDGIPSPRGIEGVSEALAERGLEPKRINGEVSKERDDQSEAPNKEIQIDEAAPDQVDPPSQTEPDSEIPAGIKAEAPVVIEPKEEPLQEEREPHTMEEPTQNELEPQIDPALRDYEEKVDFFVEDFKPERETDAVPTDLEPVTDVTSATSADEIKADADDGLDEVQSSGESATVERRSAYVAGPIDNESGLDESSLEMETKTDAASGDLAPASDDVAVMDIPSVEAESEVHDPPVEVKSEADTTPIELDANNGPYDSPAEAEQETDGALAESKPEVEDAQVEEREAATPVDTKPDTEDALTMERELETHAASTVADREGVPEKEIALDAQRDMAAAPADTEAETDYVGQDVDTSSDGIPTDAGASLNEIKADPSPDKLPLEASVASLENERKETDLDENAERGDAEHNEASGAEIQAHPALEPEMEALKEAVPEKNLEGGETSAETEAKPELLPEAETESKPEDVTEDTSLENLPEIESEAKVDVIDEAKPEDEACVETKAEESGAVQSNVDRQGLVEEVKAVPEFEPEPEVETPRGIELEGETVDAEGKTGDAEPEPEVGASRGKEVGAEMVDAVPEPEVETSRGIELEAEAVDAEPEPAAEALVDLEPDKRGLSETQSGQADLLQMEPDQSGDQQLAKQEVEEDVGELATSIPEVSQSLESEARVDDASEVPEVENEPTAISASDNVNIAEDSTSSVSSSDSSDHGEAEKTVIKPEPEIGDDIPPSATALRGEGEVGVFDYNQESSVEDEHARGVAGDIEEGAADEIRDESKEDTDRQDRAVDAGRDEGEGVLASAGSGDETEKASEQEVATIELPPAAVAESAREDIGDEFAKEDIGNQERTVDVGHDEDEALLGSAGKCAEVEEQELRVELPPADTFTVIESTTEGPPPSDPEQVIEHHHPIDEGDRSAAGNEPPRVESEQNLEATMPVESETFSGAPAPQDEAVTPATDKKVGSEHEFPFESACAEPEKDVGEEEAASSTLAEAGSVLNDFDERASYEQDLLPADFTSVDQDMDTSDSKESDGSLETEAPDYVGTGLREQVDAESTEAANPAEAVHSALPDEASSDEQSHLLQPEQAAQDSGQDNTPSPKEVLGNKELKTDGEERATVEDDKVAASSILGSALPVFIGDELISKALTHLGNGQQSMSNPEGLGRAHRAEYSAQSEANDKDKTEIHAMETRELKEADLHKPMGVDTDIDADKPSVESPSPTPGDRDTKDVQAFRQETTKEASQPVVVPTQDRGLEHVNVKSTEQWNREGTAAVEGRRKILGCCGLFDVLLGKN